MVFAQRTLADILIMHISWNVIIELENMFCMWNASIFQVISVGGIIYQIEKYRHKKWLYLQKYSLLYKSDVQIHSYCFYFTNQIILRLWYISLASGLVSLSLSLSLSLCYFFWIVKNLENGFWKWDLLNLHTQLWDGKGKTWDLLPRPCHAFGSRWSRGWKFILPGSSGSHRSSMSQIPHCLATPRVSLILVFWVTAVHFWFIHSQRQPLYWSAGHPRSAVRAGQQPATVGCSHVAFFLEGAPLQDGQLRFSRPSDTKVSLLSYPTTGGLFVSRESLNSHSLMGGKESPCLEERGCFPRRTWGFLSYFSMEQRRNKTFLRHELNAWWGHAAGCMWHSDIKLLCVWVAAHLELFNLRWTLGSVMQFILII